MNNFEPLNRYFDKIYVVSLKRSYERHEVLKERLNGLDYELFWGVDGREENIDVLESKGLYNHEQYNLNRLIKGEPVRNLSMGRVGCSLSHVNIYKDIVENEFKRVLILEDDVYVKKSEIEYFKDGINELPEDWELLYLSFSGGNGLYSFPVKVKFLIYNFLNHIGLKKYDPVAYRQSYPRPYSAHLEYSGYHYGAFGYAVSLSGAAKILKYQRPVTREADNILGELCKFGLIKAYNFKKHIVSHDYEMTSVRKNT